MKDLFCKLQNRQGEICQSGSGRLNGLPGKCKATARCQFALRRSRLNFSVRKAGSVSGKLEGHAYPGTENNGIVNISVCAASRIAAGNLTERIATSNSHTELDQLGHVLNDTFERLAALIEQQKRFTADASHELRTPLTVIISETQRALKRDRDPEGYRTIITHCQTAAKRMHSLVHSLLLLARQDTETDVANQPTTDLAAVASSAADMLASLAVERSTKIQRHLSHAPVTARPEVLEILLQNLLGNAISHMPEGTCVTVRTSVCDDCVILEVHDDGPGIPAEHLPHLFDRFYRADAARTQGSGHSGLGLAIVRSIVKTLHGRIEIESSPSIGTTFKVSFNAPL